MSRTYPVLITEELHQLLRTQSIKLRAAGMGLLREQMPALHFLEASAHSSPSRRRRKSSSS